jgi:hypothetical protein
VNLNDELGGMTGKNYFLNMHYIDNTTSIKIGMAYFKLLSYFSASTDRKLS